MSSLRPIAVLSGSSHPQLARAVAVDLRAQLEPIETARFPDGELSVRVVGTVRGEHVFVVQSTGGAAEQHVFELCLLADACRRAGAQSVTALVPYLGYARSDRRRREGDPVPVRVVTDLLAAAGVHRVVGVDVHCSAIEAISAVPFEHLSAVPLLIEAIRGHALGSAVVVAPDLGAAKLAQRVAKALSLPAAFVHKERRSGAEVGVRGLTGDVVGRKPLIVDDIISTGGTIEATIKLLLEAGCTPAITVFATHGLFVGPALERLTPLPIERVIVSDSVPPPNTGALRVHRVSLARLLADAARALHGGQSLEQLLSRT